MSTSFQFDDSMTTSAPCFSIPNMAIVSIEHPCLVRNSAKAIDMLGGDGTIATILQADSDKPLSLNFRPQDPTSRSVISFQHSAENVLLKVTVPKRTGRRRKRGFDTAFEDCTSDDLTKKDARHLVQSLKDNSDKYTIEPIGGIGSTHIWRSMPDYVYSIGRSKFLTEIQSKILPQKYPLLKQWNLPRTYGLTNTETIPPPVFSNVSLANNYIYRQNPAVKTISDPSTGKKALLNTQAPLKIHTHQCKDNDPEYPSTPPTSCPPLVEQSPAIQRVHGMVSKLFEERPIWTRRALLNNLPDDAPIFFARFALAYIGFAIRSGPWRDTICKLGLDPRKDPCYRKYQTLFLQLMPRDGITDSQKDEFARSWNRSKDKKSHIFSGSQKVIAADGKVWQYCDLEDPQLKALVDVPDVYVRSECETRYFGWYHNGTTAKIRVALKAKVDCLSNGPPLDDSVLQRFLALPEQWDGEVKVDWDGNDVDPMSGYLPKDASRRELEWASVYRSLCRTQEGKVPASGGSGKGRLSKSKPRNRTSYLDPNLDETDKIEVQNGGSEDEDPSAEFDLPELENN